MTTTEAGFTPPDATTLRNGALVFAGGMALAFASFLTELAVIHTFRKR